MSKGKSSKKQFASQMNEYDEEDEEEDDHTHTHTHSNSRDPRNHPPPRKPAEEMMKNQEEEDEEYSHQHTDSHEHTSDSAEEQGAAPADPPKNLALNSSKKNQMSMNNLATLPVGAKQTASSPKVEGNKDMKIDPKLKTQLNHTSEEAEDEKYTSQNNDEDEKYTTEQNYTDEYSSVQNKTGMNFNKAPAEVNEKK